MKSDLRRTQHLRRVTTLGALILVLAAAPAFAQAASLVRTSGWRHAFDPGPGDLGIGVLAFAPDFGPGGTGSRPDSLPLHDRVDGPPVGYFVFTPDSAGGWSYTVVWRAPLAPNLLEFDYEVAGLPVDSLTRDSAWARVLPGFGEGNRPLRAWARSRTGTTGLVLWSERLPENALFFLPGVPPTLLDAPEGTPVTFSLGEAGDYVLHPLEARGPWMRVRAVTPSDTCAEPQSPRTADVWIRYLEASGRPRVWYHTRGC